MNKPYFVAARNTTPEEPHSGWYIKPREETPPIGAFNSKSEAQAAQEALNEYIAELTHPKEQQ